MCIRDRDVPVLMTNFPTILNRLTGMFSEDRSEFIASFDEYDPVSYTHLFQRIDRSANSGGAWAGSMISAWTMPPFRV